MQKSLRSRRIPAPSPLSTTDLRVAGGSPTLPLPPPREISPWLIISDPDPNPWRPITSPIGNPIVIG
jgi:hypothetical protein